MKLTTKDYVTRPRETNLQEKSKHKLQGKN